MVSAKEKKMLAWLRGKSADLGQLDILVEDIKCRQANQINMGGIQKQVQYLLRYYTPRALRNLVRHELKLLKKGGMLAQSKTMSKKNRRRRV